MARLGYSRLYIIGNGFDLHYGIRSSYKDFLNYLEENESELFDLLFNLFPASLWKNFESALGELRPGALDTNLFGLIVRDGDSDYAWERESASLNYHFFAMKKELDIVRINSAFRKWVEQIDISVAKVDSTINDTKDTCYLTFNYTRTLEDRFGIDKSRVLHIHGEVGDDLLIVGHAHVEDKGILPPQQYYEQDMLEELRSRFIDQTEKPVSAIIAMNSEWFESLRNVEEVIVSGFSFSDVDLPYIRQVVSHIRPSAKWRVFERRDVSTVVKPVLGEVEAICYP